MAGANRAVHVLRGGYDVSNVSTSSLTGARPSTKFTTRVSFEARNSSTLP
jgi:hypothetical protein